MKNVINLLGHVGSQPEVRHLENTSVATFTLATFETFKNKSGEKQTDVQWHNIVVWGKLAEVVEKYVNKGDKLDLTGKIKYESYDDKEGNKKYSTKIVCNQMIMLGSKSVSSDSQVEEPIQNEPEDDLPF